MTDEDYAVKGGKTSKMQKGWVPKTLQKLDDDIVRLESWISKKRAHKARILHNFPRKAADVLRSGDSGEYRRTVDAIVIAALAEAVALAKMRFPALTVDQLLNTDTQKPFTELHDNWT